MDEFRVWRRIIFVHPLINIVKPSTPLDPTPLGAKLCILNFKIPTLN